MHPRRTLAGSLVLTLLAATGAAVLFSGPPVHGTDLAASRLVALDPLPAEASADACEWEVASPQLALSYLASFQGPRAAAPAADATGVSARKPIRTVQDPYAGFSAIRVDPVRNEVVVMDEFKYNIYVYDRTATTPDSAPRTEPKRVIGGPRTKSRYNSDGYVDPKTGDIYIVNNDSEPGMYVFSRQKNGNVSPDRGLVTPYGGFGITVDEEKQEILMTVQHDGAVVVFSKTARDKDNPIRLLQGDRTRLADPHGIAFDTKNRLMYVANYGTSRLAIAGSQQQMPNPLNTLSLRDGPRVPNWPAGNTIPYSLRQEVVFGTGKFGPPSITVHRADAVGNVAPLRVIEGPKTQLNWPTGISVDPERGEVYVANAAGDSVNVFSATAQGDVAPIRVIKGPRTLLRDPNGVSVDTVNGEIWVANFGNHTATAYTIDANGNAAPTRVIRSAPLNAPTTLISNPYMIAYDSRRDEVLVPNCVAQPRIAAYSVAADKNAVPTRIIEGQNTRLNRTVHSIAYDEIHDEIVVQSNIGQAVVTYRGGANGDEAPIRIIQGPKTLLRDPQVVFSDPVHNEIYALNMGVDDTLLVFDRTAQGDVAPKRVLKTQAAVAGVGAVDPVNNLLFLSGRGANGVLVYDRTAEDNAKPLRTIGGGRVSGLRSASRIVVYPPAHKVVVTTSGGGGGGRGGGDNEDDITPTAYVGVWNEEDNGDVAPQWTITKSHLYMARGLTLDPKNKTVIVSDKYLNAVMTFSLPEMFTPSPRARETARSQ